VAKHLHKSFRDQQVISLLRWYLNQEIESHHILGVLGIGRSRFFQLLKRYRENPSGFTVTYQRTTCPRKIASEVEKNILQELRQEKRLIEDPEVSVKAYNDSYVRDIL